MKKAVISGKRKAEIVEAPDLEPKDDWVLVKVHAAPMCTEYKQFEGGAELQNLGHEAVGEVIATAQPCCVKEGDRVVVMPMWNCGRCPLCVSGDIVHCQRLTNFADWTKNYVDFTGTENGTGTYNQSLLSGCLDFVSS